MQRVYNVRVESELTHRRLKKKKNRLQNIWIFSLSVFCMYECGFTNAGSVMLGEARRTFTGEATDGVKT